jgi:hypothetical protein
MSIELKHLRYADAVHRCQLLKSGGSSCRLIGSMPANVRVTISPAEEQRTNETPTAAEHRLSYDNEFCPVSPSYRQFPSKSRKTYFTGYDSPVAGERWSRVF